MPFGVMDLSDLLAWIVGFSCLGLIAQFLWIDRGSGRGWFGVGVGVLLLTLGGVWLRWRWLTWVGEGAWVLLVLVPAILFVIYHRCQAQQRFAAARRVGLVIRVFHPADGWREVPELMRAMELAQRGEQTAALGIYRRVEERGGMDALLAAAQSFRITNRWEEFMEWRRDNLGVDMLHQHPALLPLVLRGFGETGDPNGMVAWFEQFQERIERLPMVARHSCRLTLYAFCGQRAQVEQLLNEALAHLPEDYQQYWKATAAQAAGADEEAREWLGRLVTSRDHLVRGAVGWRTEHPLPLASALSDAAWLVLRRAERVQVEEERFNLRSGLWTRRARVTQGLILANLVMFGVEMGSGGSMDEPTLARLGALLIPEGAPPGWWWRLGSSLFLHYGAAHLSVNMLALAWLGPPVERALGRARYLALYLLAGIGSGAVVLLLTSNRSLVGASGSIMALIGAGAAITLRGWVREKARYAARQFLQFIMVIAAQTLFDIFTPQISFLAHASGLLLGFLIASILPHRGAPAPIHHSSS